MSSRALDGAVNVIMKRSSGLGIRSFFPVSLLLVVMTSGCTKADPLEEIRSLHAERRYAESIEPLRALIDRGDDDPEVFYLYGVALTGTREVTKAVWPLRRAMESPEWYEPAAMNLAQLSVLTSDWDMAITILDELLEHNPDHEQATLVRAYARAQSRQDYEGSLADADSVLATDPDNSDALVVRAVSLLGLQRIDEAGEAIEAAALHFEETGLGLAGSAKFCTVRATFAKEKGDLERAEEIFSECAEEHATDFLVIDRAVKFFDEIGRPERSLEVIRAAFDAAPSFRSYRLSLVQRLAAMGEYEEAEALLRESTRSPQVAVVAEAYIDLARFYFQRDRLDEAVEAFGEANRLLKEPGPEFLFAYSDALVAAGRYDEAVALTEGMTLVAHRELVHGRVALARGDPEAALAHFTEGQKLWPNNAVSRYFSALAAEQLGDFDRAVEEYRYSIRADASATDARMRLARLYDASGDPEQAVFSLRHEADTEPAVDPVANMLYEIELLGRLGRTQSMPERIKVALRQPALWPSAVSAMATGVRESRGSEAAVTVVLGADRLDLTHPVNAVALWSLVDDLIALGRVPEARKRVDAARKAHPEAGILEALHASVLERTGASDTEVRAAWERAVELAPENAIALKGLAAVRLRAGESKQALALYERAATADATDTAALRAAASIHRAAGRDDDAELALRTAYDRNAYEAATVVALADLLASRGAEADRREVATLLRRAERFGAASDAARLRKAG